MPSVPETPPARLAIFASGGGSNAQKIIEYFSDKPDVEVALVCTNRPGAGVIAKAYASSVPVIVLAKQAFQDQDVVLPALRAYQIDYIALAGFLLLIPPFLIGQFPDRIVNIHPALLPKYGGKGMYGMNVHRAVKESGEKHSGMTIHYVNENYDEGAIIFQDTVALNPSDTPEQIAARVLELEHRHYPRIIHKVIRKDQAEHFRSDN